MKLSVKDILAILLTVIATVGLFGILTGDGLMLPSKGYDYVLSGTVRFAYGFGWTCLMVALAFILVGHQDKLSTRPDDEE